MNNARQTKQIRKKLQSPGKRFLSVLLSLVIVLSGMLAGMPMTAYADSTEGAYTEFIPVQTDDQGDLENKLVTFNGMQWYLIEDNSISQSSGTVTLLTKDYVGTSVFGNTTEYVGSTVQTYLSDYYNDHFSGLDDAVVNGTYGRLYLLSSEEASAITNRYVLQCAEYDPDSPSHALEAWWLRSSVSEEDQWVAIVSNSNSRVEANWFGWEFCVRPAVKLNLEAVSFSEVTKTFTVKGQHTHHFTYTATDNTITATCSEVECTLPDQKTTLSLSAPGGTYNGTTPYGASVSDVNRIKGSAQVKYYVCNDNGTRGAALDPITTAPKNAGKYWAEITLGEEGQSATAHVVYTISKADPPIATMPEAFATYGQTLGDITLNNPEGNPEGVWAFTDALTTSVGDVGENTFKANFTPDDQNNYNSVSDVDITVTVNKADLTVTAPQVEAIYGQTLGNITLSNPTGNPAGTWAFVDAPGISVGNVGTHTFKANFTPTDTTNYNAVSNVDVTVTVKKADPSVTAPRAEATYGQILSDVQLSNPSENIAGVWTWAEEGSTSVGTVGEHTFKAVFTPTDSVNYNTVGNVDVKVVVGRADNPATVVNTAVIRKGGKTIDLANYVKLNGAAGTVSYEINGEAHGASLNGSILTSGNQAGSVTVKVAVAQDENYYALSDASIIVTITDKDIQVISAEDVTVTYGDVDKYITATVSGNTTVSGNETVSGNGALSFAVKEGSENYIAINENSGELTIKKAGTATVLVTAAETEDFARAEAEVTVTILPADSSVTKVPAAAALTYTGGAQQLVAEGTAAGGTMQYALGTETTVTGSFDDTVPTETNAGTYYVWYKVAGDENHNSTTPASVKAEIGKANGPAKVEKTATAYINGKLLDLSACVKGAAGKVTYAIIAALEGCSVDATTGAFTQGSKQGECTVAVSIAESDNYKAQTEEIKVSVIPKIGAELDVVQADGVFGTALSQPTYVIKGTEDKPVGGEVRVSYTGKLRKDGSDYISETAPTEAGNYIVGIHYETDTTIYAGYQSFQINPLEIRDAEVALSETEFTYTGSEQTVTITEVTLGERELTAADYTVSGNQATDADDYTLTVSANAAGNYTGSITKTYTIKKGTPYVKTYPTAAVITYGQTLADSVLSGGAVQISETIDTPVVGTFAWKEQEITPHVSDNNSAGYEVVFTPKDSKNLEPVTIGVPLQIAKAEVAPGIPESTMEVGYKVKKAKDIVLSGNWKIRDADLETELTVGKAVTVMAEYTGSDRGSYETESVNISVTRKEQTYADLIPASTDTKEAIYDKLVTFNGMQWYLIENNSTSKNSGTVTLLAKDHVGTSVFGNSTDYVGSTIQNYLATYYNDHFSGLDDAVVEGEFGRLYLLSVEEAKAISNSYAIKCADYVPYTSSKELEGWWLCSSVSKEAEKVAVVNNTTQRISDDNGDWIGKPLCVRPALKLNLDAVEFSFDTQTFTLKQNNQQSQDDTKPSQEENVNEKEVKQTTTTETPKEREPAVEKETPKTPETPETPEKQETTKVQPEGTKISDGDQKAEYVVISKAGETPSVAYQPAADVKDKTIKIPESVTADGVTYQVTAIAENAFKGNKTVKSIVVSASVTQIGSNAFAGCKNLKTVTIGKNVRKLGANLFKGCKKLGTIIVKSAKLSAADVNKKAFKGVGNKVKVKVPKKQKKAYIYLFRKKGLSKKVRIK